MHPNIEYKSARVLLALVIDELFRVKSANCSLVSRPWVLLALVRVVSSEKRELLVSQSRASYGVLNWGELLYLTEY